MDKDVRYWVDLSSYDIGTALAMYKTGRYIYVLFMCQQAAEKMLKALIVHRTKSFHPKVHDLERLAGVCQLELPKEHAELLRALTAYYNESMAFMATKTVRLSPVVGRALRLLRREIAIEAAVLFGSRAAGSADRWSDFDLAVFSPTVEGWTVEE